MPQTLRYRIIYSKDTRAAPIREAAGVLVKDSEGHPYSAYDVSMSRFSAIVVRPDGVVGAMISGVGGLRAYLTEIVDCTI